MALCGTAVKVLCSVNTGMFERVEMTFEQV